MADLKNIKEGYQPPSDIELEKYVIGAIMVSREAMIQVIDMLSPDTFFYEDHKIIFTHIITLFKEGVHPDLLTLGIEVQKKSPQIQISYLAKLSSDVVSTSNIEFNARYLSELAIRRKLIIETSGVAQLGYDKGIDIFDLISTHESNIQNTIDFYTKAKIKTARELTAEALYDLEQSQKREEGITGVPTGFFELDKITSGWQKSDMIVVAARPGMGKTAFILSMAKNIAINFKIPIGIFSLEMSATQLIKRLIAVQCEINSSSIRAGKLSEAEFLKIHQSIQPLIDAPMYFDDSAGLSILDLKTKATRLKKQYGVQIIMIDYLQLMTSGNLNSGNREQEISSISRAIKMLAKELEMPIIALSQLSRSVEQRSDKRPMLSDLRESGAIEQDADLVTFLYRPEYYGQIQDENGESLIGKAEIIVAKHRNGSLDTATVKYISQFTKFENEQTNFMTQENIKPNTSFDEEQEADILPF